MAKTKKDIILELKRVNPNLTPGEAAAAVPCTLAYAKRILAAEQVKLNGEINDYGRQIGITEEEMEEWHQWVVDSIFKSDTIAAFRSMMKLKKAKEKWG